MPASLLAVQGTSDAAVVYAVRSELFSPSVARGQELDHRLRPRWPVLRSQAENYDRVAFLVLQWYWTTGIHLPPDEREDHAYAYVKSKFAPGLGLGLLTWLTIAKIALQIILLVLRYLESSDSTGYRLNNHWRGDEGQVYSGQAAEPDLEAK